MASLQPRAYDPLSADAIEPRGWLRRQLRIQADGITGHLDEFWDSLADNQWLGGANDGWERGPYYVDGLVPLAHLLGDDDLLAKAERWVEGFLDSQEDDGWIGPRDPVQGDAHDVWPRAIVLKVLRQHYAATGDERVLEAALSFCELLHESELEDHPLSDWGAFRWQDFVLGVHWLFEETAEDWLLELARTAAEQGYDWREHFTGSRRRYGFAHDEPSPDWNFDTHVVNNAMGVKAPAVAYRRSGDPADRDAVDNAIDTLQTYHGQATGVFTGDENLAGQDPTRGTELCAVVEYMYSLEELVSILGDVRFADRLERIAFNALPATFTEDMWAHQYDQQANQVLCAIGDYPWTNGPDANCFGLEPHYGCCTANLHQGWPKFASHCWMASEGGLAAVAYAPSAVTTSLDGTEVRVVEETDYPFEDEVRFRVEADAPVEFALDLRIPAWVDGATLHLPDGETRSPAGGEFSTVDREWHGGDEVRLELATSVEADRRHGGAVSLRRGPLTFALPIASEARRFPGEDDVPHAHREYHPTEPWNVGLAVDTAGPTCELARSAPGELPFATDDPPVELTVEGARVENWTMDGSRAGGVPGSPTEGGSREDLTLVPYGSTTLRVTEFPLLE